MDAKALVARGDMLFSKRGNLMHFWQEAAENMYPERADFTVIRSLGNTFAENLMTSYPALVRRDLGNSLGTMMRPTSIDWFSMRADREEHEDTEAKQWLEWASGVQKRAMYDRGSMFVRASKEADHDIATFGQAVKTVELNREGNGLLFRCWHLRDTAWAEGPEGDIETVHRKWKPTCATLAALYGSRIHPKVADKMTGGKKNPYTEVSCRHIVMKAEDYSDPFPGKGKVPWVEITLDADNDHIMEVMGLSHRKYIIPRWQTVSGSQYAYSPATVCALPDARLLQAMTRVILEAGEKATNPPMVAVQEALRSDVAIYAGGITWVDAQYDERLGEVLRPLTQDKSGLPLGIEMTDRVQAQILEAFFINKLSLPVNGPEMTAYEVGQRVQDYIRQASPLFEPLEDEDNGAICEATFDLMMRHGAFGSVEDIPQSIRGKDIKFRFESPLHQAVERQKGQKFMEAQQLLTQTLALDATAAANVDITTAFRDVLVSIGTPAKWIRSEQDAAQLIAAQEQEQQASQLIQTMGAGAEAAKAMGEAGQAMGETV